MRDEGKRFCNLEGNIFFLGVFFLPTALPISALLFLISTIIPLSQKTNLIKKSVLNYFIGIAIFLMIISCIYSSLNFTNFNINFYANKSIFEGIDKLNIWLDLLNWFPLFLFYWGFQKYLQLPEDRIKFAKYIFIGTIPVIISCLLQYWFKIYGPFEFLFGTIVWFQKPISFGVGVSGLFSNQNYAGAWLTTILPFSIFLILKNKNNFQKKIISFLITISHTYVLILTNSRNALLGLIISMLFIFGLKGIWIMVLGSILIILISLTFLIINPLYLDTIFQNILSNQLFIKLTNFDFSNFITFPRIEILKISSNLISKSPFFGYGAGTFPQMYLTSGGIWGAQHAHNMPFQIAYNYGIPVSITISLIFLYLLIKAYQKIFLGNRKTYIIDKCWFISSLVILIYNLTDITYYDGKISILIWILFAGLNCITEKKEIEKSE